MARKTIFILDNNVLSHVIEDLDKSWRDAPDKPLGFRRRLQSRAVGSAILAQCHSGSCLTTEQVAGELERVRLEVREYRRRDGWYAPTRQATYTFRDMLDTLKEFVGVEKVSKDEVDDILARCPFLLTQKPGKAEADASVVALAKRLRDRGHDVILVSGDRRVCDCARGLGIKTVFTMEDGRLPIVAQLVGTLVRRLGLRG